MEFQSFKKIPRLFREIVITEKIDGTNGLVAIDDAGNVKAGSRNRWVTPDADNFGFAAWVKEHESELKELGPGYHYGEWWGQGIQRRYGLDHKRFSLFNVSRYEEERPACCHVVPVLYRGAFDIDFIQIELDGLKKDGSVAAPGFMNPEGVVVFHTHSSTLFKVTLEGDKK